MTAVKLEPKALLDRMRKLSAELLGYDLSNLTPAESVRLDRAATLRLELDDVQSRQLAGLPIEMAKFILASKELEAMYGGDPEAPAAGHDFSGAREELHRFLVQRADAIEKRREREAKAIESSKPIPDPGSSDAPQSDEGVPQPPSAAPDAPATRSEPPLLIDPPPAPPPPPRRSLDEINAEPSNPPARPVEEWRRWVDENGIRTSPWSGGRY